MVLLLAAGWLLQSTAGVDYAVLVSFLVGLIAARLVPNPGERS